MTKEQDFFLKALSDFLNKRDTTPPDGLNWRQVLLYAKSHQVEGIIWYQCKKYLTGKEEYAEIRKYLELASISSLFIYANNVNAYEEIKKIFLENGIHFFTVKGLNIAALYPVPAFRTMGDIDIVMSTEDRNRIHNIMTTMGYKRTKSDYEMNFHKQNIQLEIHDHLIYKQNQETTRRKKYFGNCWMWVKKTNDGSFFLDWNYHFAFLIEHTKKHFSGNGLGFRQFMDIIVTASKVSDLDWKVIEKDLRYIGLWDFTLTAFAFCERWFNIQAPVNSGILDNDFYLETTEFVFQNGVFGRDHEHHNEHSMERRLRVYGLPRSLEKICFMLKEVFIPYKYMIQLPYCAFLVGRKYLLPYAWAYRVIYVIRNKKNKLESEYRLLFESDNAIKKHDRLMTKWGI